MSLADTTKVAIPVFVAINAAAHLAPVHQTKSRGEAGHTVTETLQQLLDHGCSYRRGPTSARVGPMGSEQPPRAVASYPDQPRRMNPHRKRGLVLLLTCAPAATGWALVLGLLGDHHVIESPLVFKLLGFPLAIAIIVALLGLAQLVFGRTFGELARAWDEMAGWQRGVVGTIIVAIAVVAIITAAGLAITLLM